MRTIWLHWLIVAIVGIYIVALACLGADTMSTLNPRRWMLFGSIAVVAVALAYLRSRKE